VSLLHGESWGFESLSDYHFPWRHTVNPIIEILMRRDGLNLNEATDVVEELAERLRAGADPEELLYEIGLEPDYIFDLVDM